MSNAPVRRLRGPTVALATGALVVGLVLAGCSDDAPDPAPLESPTASEEPSESAEPSTEPSDGPPPMPEEAKGTSKKSAEAFVRYAVEVLNYTSASLDTRRLRDISTRACSGCHAVISYVNRVSEDGGQIRGGVWTTSDLTALDSEQDALLVQAVIRSTAQMVRESAGAQAQRFPAGRAFYTFSVAPDGEGWALVQLRQEES